MKKLLSVFLVAMMIFAMGTTALADEAIVYIDATSVSQSELDAMVREAQDGQNTIIISWGEATATLKPIDASEPMPAFNINDTISLTTTNWHYMGDDYPIFQYNLKVTNKAGNPGAIDIEIVYPDYIDAVTTEYYWSLDTGYYTTFSLKTFATSELWLSASNVSGDYDITAKCS